MEVAYFIGLEIRISLSNRAGSVSKFYGFGFFKEVECGFGFLRFFILENFRFQVLTVLSKFEILVSSLEIWMFKYEWILETYNLLKDKHRNKTMSNVHTTSLI